MKHDIETLLLRHTREHSLGYPLLLRDAAMELAKARGDTPEAVLISLRNELRPERQVGGYVLNHYTDGVLFVGSSRIRARDWYEDLALVRKEAYFTGETLTVHMVGRSPPEILDIAVPVQLQWAPEQEFSIRYHAPLVRGLSQGSMSAAALVDYLAHTSEPDIDALARYFSRVNFALALKLGEAFRVTDRVVAVALATRSKFDGEWAPEISGNQRGQ